MSIRLHIDGEIFARTKYGGIHRVFDHLLRAWRESDDVSVCLHLPDGIERASYRESYGDVHAIPQSFQLRPRGYFKAFNRRLHVQRAVRHWRSLMDGVYMSTYYTTHEGLAIPQVLLLHDMIYERTPAYFSHVAAAQHCEDKARCIRAASGIVYPSAHAKFEANALSHRMVNKKECVIPHAVDPAFLKVPGVERLKAVLSHWGIQREYVLVTGGHAPHKNYFGLLSAFARWKDHHNFILLSVGGGVSTGQELAAIDALGLREHVKAIPYASPDELVLAYHGARAVVVPSFCEGFGFPVLEAMATGTPVASSNGGSLPEVGKGVAIYFDPFDQVSMIDAISQAVDMQKGHERLQNGVEIARSRDWNDVAGAYASFLKVCQV